MDVRKSKDELDNFQKGVETVTPVLGKCVILLKCFLGLRGKVR